MNAENNKPYDKVKELAQKLQALAERGEEHERNLAKAKLENLLNNYDLTSEELSENYESVHEFSYKDKFEKTLILQIAYKVYGSIPEVYNYRNTVTNRKRRNLIGIKCTKAQNIEIEFLFDFYSELFKKEVDFFIDAFIQKHELFGTPTGENTPKRSPEELERSAFLQAGMSEASPIIRLSKCDDT